MKWVSDCCLMPDLYEVSEWLLFNATDLYEVSEWLLFNTTDLYEVSEWLLFNVKSAIFQLYHGKEKFNFYVMMIS
jgi:hypothetical protein